MKTFRWWEFASVWALFTVVSIIGGNIFGSSAKEIFYTSYDTAGALLLTWWVWGKRAE